MTKKQLIAEARSIQDQIQKKEKEVNWRMETILNAITAQEEIEELEYEIRELKRQQRLIVAGLGGGRG